MTTVTMPYKGSAMAQWHGAMLGASDEAQHWGLRESPPNNRLQATAGGLGGAGPARGACAHRA